MMRVDCAGLLILASIAVGSGAVKAEGPQIRAVASKTTVFIAEPFSVRLEVITDAGSEIEFGDPAETTPQAKIPDQRIGVFDVLSTQDLKDIPMGRSDPDSDSDTRQRRVWSRTIAIETIRLGTHEIPAMKVTVNRDGRRDEFLTDPIEITVRGVIEQADEPLREIAGIIKPEPIAATAPVVGPAMWWSAIGIAGAFVTGGILWKRRQPIPPLRWCRRELAELRQTVEAWSDPINPEDWLAFSQRLREVLRTAISVHLQTEIASPSTRQLLTHCDAAMDDQTLVACRRTLSIADQMKFANTPPRSIATKDPERKAIEEAAELVESIHEGARARKRGR